MAHRKQIAANTGKKNRLGHYVPSGMHECFLCHTWDDPRRVAIKVGLNPVIELCLSCVKPYMEPLTSSFYSGKELEDFWTTIEQYPQDPWETKETSVPIRPFEAIRAQIENEPT